MKIENDFCDVVRDGSSLAKKASLILVTSKKYFV